ncbi:MAG: antibiotic biosynthesis monooxygenase [Thermoanaerobaculia bacterium]|nr:antibiotic biosynthesis monooxygenase [Thermoanaerobaculia bacterium]
MLVIIWEYLVSSDHAEAFEQIYSGGGDWAKLFSSSDGYLGTSLLHDATGAGRYLTLDRWSSREAFDAFHAAFPDEYAALDARCQELTENERKLGEFEGE